MQTLIHKIAGLVAAPLIGILSLAGYSINTTSQVIPAPQEQALGASSNTPTSPAFFETSLAASISSSATSFTLVSANNGDGGTLASSTYGMVIDEGTASQEMVLADCTATACTNAMRGLSNTTATTTIATKEFTHRRGASVKITTGPSLVFLANVFTGTQNIEFPVRYDTTRVPTTTIALNGSNLVDYDLLAYTAFNGASVVNASALVKGVSEFATQIETASSTSVGGSGNLVVANTTATSTYNSATAGLRVPVTQNNGFLDSGFLDLTTYTKQASTTMLTSSGRNYLNSGTTSLATTTLTNIPAIYDSNNNSILWSLIASSSQTAASGALTISVPTRNFLRLIIFAPGNNASNAISFNGDSTADYSYVSATTTVAGTKGGTSISLTPNSGSFSTTMDINNAFGNVKSFKAETVDSNGQIWTSAGSTTTLPLIYSVGGIWATTTPQQITTIKVGSVVAGAQVYVYGSAF